MPLRPAGLAAAAHGSSSLLGCSGPPSGLRGSAPAAWRQLHLCRASDCTEAWALQAAPSDAHYQLVRLHAAGMLTTWVQQNHDGLPQKAGLPQAALNEIHGAWCDQPS